MTLPHLPPERIQEIKALAEKMTAGGGWLIQKGALFYRPDRAGYTARKCEAGRYTEAEAKMLHEHDPRFSTRPADEVPNDPMTFDPAEVLSLIAAKEAAESALASMALRMEAAEREQTATAKQYADRIDVVGQLHGAPPGWNLSEPAQKVAIQFLRFLEAIKAPVPKLFVADEDALTLTWEIPGGKAYITLTEEFEDATHILLLRQSGSREG